MSGRNKQMLLILAGIVAVAVVVVVFVSTQKPSGNLPTFGAAITVNGCVITRGCTCPGANLSSAVIQDQTWTKCNLSGANLSGSNVSGSRSSFNQADLSLITAIGTNFSNADLSSANLSATAGNLSMAVGTATGANLTGANLTGVNLKGANLSRANLTNAVGFDSAITDSTTVFCQTTMPDGTIRTDAGKTC